MAKSAAQRQREHRARSIASGSTKLADYDRAYREKNRDAINARRRAYAARNPEKMRKKRLRWNEANRKKNSERQKAYVENNKERVTQLRRESEKRRKLTGRGRFLNLLRNAFKRAMKHGVAYNLDWEWAEKKMGLTRCEATGIEFDASAGRNAFTPSFDRVVPELGYTKSNTRVVVYIFNVAKNSFTDSEVEKLARAYVGACDGERVECRLCADVETSGRPPNSRRSLQLRR